MAAASLQHLYVCEMLDGGLVLTPSEAAEAVRRLRELVVGRLRLVALRVAKNYTKGYTDTQVRYG